MSTRPFPERLRSGERLLGVVATLATPSAVEILRHAGFDWLWLDMEHGPFDVSTALGMVQAATSIQEQTLSFVPKLIVVAISMMIFGGMILGLLGDFTTSIFERIPDLVK